MSRRVGFFSVMLLISAAVRQAQNTGLGHVPGRVLVKFRAGVSDNQAAAILASHQASVAGQIQAIGVRLVSLPSSVTESEAIRAIAAHPEVQFTELDRILPPAD